MKINVIKRKASSYIDLSKEKIEVQNPKTLLELLENVMFNEIDYFNTKDKPINNKEMMKKTKSGKVYFGVNGTLPSKKEAREVLIQDFKDGLFRVFLNEEEETDLNKEIHLKEDDTLILIKFIMLSGRLW